uniref:Atlastin-2-like n=1 Tax=Phallusia mammillata TaxID=59560 RepID=A0A6F9D6K6_9ASCI|nr:atlastin-2-like [Phallusia mammillata]
MPGDKRSSVSILSKGKDDVFKLEVPALKKVLKPAWDKPIAIISVCGDKRKGKSFILNMFLRYLEQTGSGKDRSTSMNPLKWVGSELHPAFEWRGGSRRNTEGIWILDRPLMVETSEGEVALYLMDTQGMFDSQTSKKECSQIFALATLMSSHLVFNLMRQIQANDLEYLDFWTQTAKYVESGTSEAFFQNLLFLLRDFSFADYGFGIEAGERYLNEEFTESDDKDRAVNENIRNLKNVFFNVSAFGMPEPERCVTARKEEDQPINLQAAGKDFLKSATDLFKCLRNDISPLQLNGNPMSGAQLYDYVVNCSKNLLSDKIPDPYTLSESVSMFQLRSLVDREKDKYEADMEKILEDFKGSMIDVLNQHTKLLKEALERYDTTSKFGREDVILDYRGMLELGIMEAYDVFYSYQEKKLQLKDSENRREEEAKIAQERHDQLNELVGRQEQQMKEAAAKHAKDAEDLRECIKEQERRFKEVEEARKREAEEARKVLEEQQRMFKESEIARKKETAEATARLNEQKREIQKMANDHSKEAEEARKRFKEQEERFREQEEQRKRDAEEARERNEEQRKEYQRLEELRQQEAEEARQQAEKQWEQLQALEEKRSKESKEAREVMEKQLETMRETMERQRREMEEEQAVGGIGKIIGWVANKFLK